MKDIQTRLLDLMEKRMKRSINLAFFSGSFCALCVVCLVQDWLGLEGYLDHVRENWIETPWQIWPPLILLSLIIPGALKRAARTTHD